MLKPALVTTEDELSQIHKLNRHNLKSNFDTSTQRAEGFVTWLYSFDLLSRMHQLAPSVIVKDGWNVVGYALTALKESKDFHTDLEIMFSNLEPIQYKGKPLSLHNFYCMGQICVAKEYRGKGIVNMLYQKHREVFASDYDFLLTEISTGNPRSLKAHEKAGFKPIHTYSDAKDEWEVVIWDWK